MRGTIARKTLLQLQATVDEDCPKCGHHQLEYYTMQLRSADEGQVRVAP